MDEREAIARCKRRDPSGLEVLVRLHQQQAVRLAALITRDRQSAEDAVADSFLTAYERIHQFDDERPFGPWFRRIVANAALKAVSRHDRTVPLESLADQEGLDGDWLARLADPAPGPAEHAEHAEARAAVRAALAALPPKQQAAVVLRYYEDLGEGEIAAIPSVPRGTVKSRLAYGLARLRVLQYSRPLWRSMA